MLRRAAFLVVLAVILGACTTTPKGEPAVVPAPAVPPHAEQAPQGLPQGRPLGACTGTAPVVPITQEGATPVVEMGQWFVEEEQSLLVADWPFAWMDLQGGSRTADQPWKPLGYANGRFLVVPLEQ